MRTPAGQVRGLGSAKEGTGHFIASRVTAVALLILVFAFVILLVSLLGLSYEAALARLAAPVPAMVLFATVVLTVVHMRLGMQVIIEDYVHHDITKFALLIANWLFSWGVGLVCIYAILRIAFGG